MSLALAKADLDGNFGKQLDAKSGARLSACIQCKKCSTGCPVSKLADVKPHEIVRLAQLGQRDELLGSKMIWQCTSCQTCATRCPQQVSIAALNDELRRLSRVRNAVNQKATAPVFNDAFLASVEKRGRIYEVGLMAAYKLKTLRLFEDMTKLPMMLRKGKLRLLPSAPVPGARERREIFQRAQKARGK